MIKAAIYIRVSTQEQVENYSIEVQRERIQAFCKAKNWEVYDEYIDGGYSGANLDRPDMQRLLKDLKKIDVVVVFKLDRLSRSQKDTLELIEEHFLKNNVDFVSITETLDTSTPFGKAMIGILSVFAQLERETIAERMRMGHVKRAENGLRGMGGDYDPAGYARIDGQLIIKKDEADHIKRAFDLYEQYHSITRVQETLKQEGYSVWRFRRYRDILVNHLYIGLVSFAGKHYEGQHEAIISKEQFDRVQRLIERHKGHNAHKAKQSLLTGLIKCQKCGESFISYSTGASNKNPRIYYYYMCKARRFPSEFEKKCTNKNWSRKKIEDIIITEIKNLTIEKSHTLKKEKKTNYDKLIKEIDKKMERLLDLFTTKTNTSRDLLEKQMEKYNLEKESLIKKQQLSENELTISEEMLFTIRESFDSLDFKDKQVIINNFIKEIYINDDDVKIVWRF